MIGKEYVGPAFWIHPLNTVVECEVISDHLGINSIVSKKGEHYSVQKSKLFFCEKEANIEVLRNNVKHLNNEIEYTNQKLSSLKLRLKVAKRELRKFNKKL